MSKNTEKKAEGTEEKEKKNQSLSFSNKIKNKLFSTLTTGIKRTIIGRKDPREYFYNILEISEFEGLEKMVQDTDGRISWDELIEAGVIKINRKNLKGIYWKSPLNLQGTKIESLWKIKKIGRNLNCENLATLKDLGELEEVGLYLDLRGTSIRSLGRLKKVGRYLNCKRLETLEDIGELEEVGGSMNLKWTKVKTLGKLKKVEGNLNCDRLGTLKDLGELQKVVGSVWLTGTSIETLGKLKKVEGNLNCDRLGMLKDLGELEEVIDNLWLAGTRIKTLGKLKKVGGTLDCKNVKTLEDLGELEEVGGDLNLKGCNIKIQLEVIKKIREGKLKVGELQYDEYIDNIYGGGNLNYEEFCEMFGYDIKRIEDEFMRKQAIGILKREYENKKEEIKKKFDKIREENNEKNLTEEEKRKIKDEIKEWDIELKEVREKIESFGIKL